MLTKGVVMGKAWRIVVAVSELPVAPELVRAGKRLADALRAPWTAVYIETRRSQSLGNRKSSRSPESSPATGGAKNPERLTTRPMTAP